MTQSARRKESNHNKPWFPEREIGSPSWSRPSGDPSVQSAVSLASEEWLDRCHRVASPALTKYLSSSRGFLSRRGGWVPRPASRSRGHTGTNIYSNFFDLFLCFLLATVPTSRGFLSRRLEVQSQGPLMMEAWLMVYTYSGYQWTAIQNNFSCQLSVK